MEFTFLSYWLKAQKRSCRSLFFQQCTKALQKHAEIMESISDIIGPREQNPGAFLYKENHALDAWFNKAYGGE